MNLGEMEPPADQHVGRRTTSVDAISPFAARSLHDLLDRPGRRPRDGDVAPDLWHWLCFLPESAQGALRADGHPKRDPVLPEGLPEHRVFGSTKVNFGDAIRIGELMTRQSTVGNIVQKSGRSGAFVLTGIDHVLRGIDGRELVREHQEVIFRSGNARRPSSAEGDEASAAGDWPLQRDLHTDPVVLFRFSALTYNAHRIHYDVDYARETEGYQDLVVHGPLQAVALADMCQRHFGPNRLKSVSFRAIRPAFGNTLLRLRGRIDENRVQLVAIDEEDRITVRAKATLR